MSGAYLTADAKECLAGPYTYAVLRSDGKFCQYHSCCGSSWTDVLDGALMNLRMARHTASRVYAFDADKSIAIVEESELERQDR